ncbi:family 2 glycosyl transferase [Sesbania bispinosa]|nr:family 2 glycosyl transferase [Sesbania bispinosa]
MTKIRRRPSLLVVVCVDYCTAGGGPHIDTSRVRETKRRCEIRSSEVVEGTEDKGEGVVKNFGWAKGEGNFHAKVEDMEREEEEGKENAIPV